MKSVSVKAKAKLKDLLDDSMKDKLILANDLENKIRILKDIYPFLNRADSKVICEEKLRENYFRQLKSLEYFLDGLEKEFYQLYFSIHQIYLIQEILSSILNGSLKDNYKKFKLDPFFTGLKLKEDSSLDDFVGSIKDSKKRRILQAVTRVSEDQMIFLSSNLLIKDYYRSLLKLSKKFPYKEAKIINDFLAKEINLLNIETAYRLKAFFDVGDKEVFNYLIEGGYLFNSTRLKEVSELDKDKFVSYFEKTSYADLFDSERYFYISRQDKRWKTFKDEIIKERSTTVYLVSVMNLLYLNFKNIISILEMDERFTSEEKEKMIIGR